ncbi:MAG: radical SAM protein [Acidiphilium sp.]|jgi:radical SAM protein with 4Fe4S-binding SPASM domain|nr:radical SAM protein [Acidiphilium sp.]MDD4937289.1 radical SAM protein [Acidiphilium sp.]
MDKFIRYRDSSDVLERHPVHVVWETTLACNLKCSHCGSRAGKKRRDELNTTESLNLIDELSRLGTREITFIGGEAFMRADWVELVAHATGLGIRTALQTGGYRFDRKKAEKVAAAGLSTAGVSIDGLQKRHDKLRGVSGSYDSAINALRCLREVGISTSVNTQITSGSFDDLPTLFDLLCFENILAWQVQLTVAMGNAADDPTLLIQPYELLTLMPILDDIQKLAKFRNVTFTPGNNIGYYGPYEHSWRRNLFTYGYWDGCSAGETTMGIEADGTIKGCPSLPTSSYRAGNVRETRLADIWESREIISAGSRRVDNRTWGYCGSCYYSDVCRAGCTWTSHVLLDKPGNNPYCHYRALQLDRRGLREEIHKVTDATGKPFDHGLFEIRVIDDTGNIVRVERSSDDLPSMEPNAGSNRNSPTSPLVVCQSCDEYRYEIDSECPHCGFQHDGREPSVEAVANIMKYSLSRYMAATYKSKEDR